MTRFRKKILKMEEGRRKEAKDKLKLEENYQF